MTANDGSINVVHSFTMKAHTCPCAEWDLTDIWDCGRKPSLMPPMPDTVDNGT